MEAERSIMFNNPKSELNKQRTSLLELWGPFLIAAIYVRNRSMTNTEDSTPYEKYCGKAPKVDHLRVPGCRAAVHVPDALRHKLQPKAVDCWFIGYAETQKTWLFWDENTRKVISSRDATFFESEIYRGRVDEKPSSPTLDFAEPILIVTELLRRPTGSEVPPERVGDIEADAEPERVDEIEADPALLPPEPPHLEPLLDMEQAEEEIPAVAPPIAVPQPQVINHARRSNRTPKYTEQYRNYMDSLAEISDWVEYGNTQTH